MNSCTKDEIFTAGISAESEGLSAEKRGFQRSYPQRIDRRMIDFHEKLDFTGVFHVVCEIDTFREGKTGYPQYPQKYPHFEMNRRRLSLLFSAASG